MMDVMVLGTWTKYSWGEDNDGLAHGFGAHFFSDGTVLSETPDVLREG